MAPPLLAVRNLTGRALEVTRVERLASGPGAAASLLGRVAGLLGRDAGRRTRAGDDADDDDAAAAAAALTVPPFAAARSAVPAPDGGAEVLRLTFEAGGRRYEADVPGPSRGASAAVRRLADADADADAAPPPAPPDLTAVWAPAAAVLAVFPSPPPHAWMRALDDAWPLTALSIPGTHNSPTCHTALPSVRCQAVGVAAQLRNGVRFLDVRVSVSPDDDALALVHSAFPIALTGNKYLAALLDDVYRFLDDNPSEAVIVSLKREGTGKGTDAHLARCLERAHVDARRHRWWAEPAIPTLGQARGRIVLVRRFGLDDDMRRTRCGGRGWAIDAEHWPDNCEDGTGGEGGCFRIQDFYDVSETRLIDTKIGYCCGQLRRAAAQPLALREPGAPVPPFFVNFLTASNFFNAACWPESIAARVNPAVVEHLCASHGDDPAVGCAGTGIVVTDWVGADDDWDLVRCVVGMNARLQHAP